MTQEDIIRMAREAGFSSAVGKHIALDVDLERFAALVAAAERNSWPAEMEAMERQVNILTDALAQAKAEEREACAAICDRFQARDVGMQPADCAGAIRARGQA